MKVWKLWRRFPELWHYSGRGFKAAIITSGLFMIYSATLLGRDEPTLEPLIVTLLYLLIMAACWASMERRIRRVVRETEQLKIVTANFQDVMTKPVHEWPPHLQENYKIVIAEHTLPPKDDL